MKKQYKTISTMTYPILRFSLLGLLALFVMACTGCASEQAQEIDPTLDQLSVDLVDEPPSIYERYCTSQGYLYGKDRLADCEYYDVCIFPDGRECEINSFLNGKCGQQFSFCESEGYKLREGDGILMAMCVFPDGSECPELDYFDGICGP